MLGDVIRRHGLVKRRVADAVGVTPETVSRWVHGHTTPRGAELVKLLDHLRQYEPGLEASDLMDDERVSA